MTYPNSHSKEQPFANVTNPLQLYSRNDLKTAYLGRVNHVKEHPFANLTYTLMTRNQSTVPKSFDRVVIYDYRESLPKIVP